MIEKSAGAVVFYRGNEIEYLLLLSTYWGFPKGLVAPGEDEPTAAWREIREETGLDVALIDGFRHVDDYWYQRSGRRIHKQAVYYLAEARSRAVTISWEHEGYVWLPFEQAMERMKFAGLRQLLADADEYVRRKTGDKRRP